MKLYITETVNGLRHVGDHISRYEGSDLVFIGPNIPHLNFDYGVKTSCEIVVVQMKENFLGRDFLTLPEMNEIKNLFERANSGVAFHGGTKKLVSDRFLYDGKTFAVFTEKGKPFFNVRTIIEDKKGNIWLGGRGGLWRYNGSTFTNFTTNTVLYVYEDKKGNIWTSSQENGWALSRYDEKSLSEQKPSVAEIISNSGMPWGIFEDSDGNIWFGGFDGCIVMTDIPLLILKIKKVRNNVYS